MKGLGPMAYCYNIGKNINPEPRVLEKTISRHNEGVYLGIRAMHMLIASCDMGSLSPFGMGQLYPS